MKIVLECPHCGNDEWNGKQTNKDKVEVLVCERCWKETEPTECDFSARNSDFTKPKGV